MITSIYSSCGFLPSPMHLIKNIQIHLDFHEIETVYCCVYQERYGLVEMAYEGLIEPKKKIVDLPLDVAFLSEHENWFYCLKGRAAGKTLCQLEGKISDLLKISENKITLPFSTYQRDDHKS